MNRREAIFGTLAAAVAASAGPSAAVPTPPAAPPLPAKPVGRILVDGHLVPEGYGICLRGRHPMPFSPAGPVWHFECIFSERFK